MKVKVLKSSNSRLGLLQYQSKAKVLKSRKNQKEGDLVQKKTKKLTNQILILIQKRKEGKRKKNRMRKSNNNHKLAIVFQQIHKTQQY